MKLSIIMPCFNVASTLPRALDSIIMQETNFEYEILIVDDASTDKTAELARKYSMKYPQVRIIYNEFTKGNAYAYYKGLCASKGDYICVLHGEDYYTIPDKLQRQVDFLESDKEGEYVGTATQYIIDVGDNMVSIPERSNFRWCSYADFLTQKTECYHESTYMYRNIFRGNVPYQIRDALYSEGISRIMFYLKYSGKKIWIMDFVGSAYTYEFTKGKSLIQYKEHCARQVLYQLNHRRNVSTDFERACADRQIEFYQDQMATAEDGIFPNPSISIEKAIKYITEYAGTFAFAQKDFVLQHAYFSSYIDTLCASLGYIDLVRNPFHLQKEKDIQNICIVHVSLNPHGGGIFAEIKELFEIYSDKSIYLLITGMEKIPEQISKDLLKYSNLKILCPPTNCVERFKWLREQLVKIAPYRVYYYCSHNDAYTASLMQKGCCENITLFSFDHGYICGISNPNLNNIIAKRPTDYWMLKNSFGKKVIFIPTWNHRARNCESKRYIPFKNHNALITASGAARFYKIDGKEPYRYIDIVVALLKNTGGIHYHFGELPDDMLLEIKTKMELAGITQEHFVYIQWADNIPLRILESHVDVFIEPFPVVSYKLTLEVLSVGIPVIAYQGLERMSIADFLPQDTMQWKTQEELISILTNVTGDFLIEKSKKALEYFNTYHCVETISKFLRENKSLSEPENKPYPDNTLIDITSSFRLFGDNYRISIMWKEIEKRRQEEERKRQEQNDKGGGKTTPDNGKFV